jgi:membrane dipeptidase
VSQVSDHVDHIRSVAGIDHAGIGSEFYGGGGPSMAEGLGDVTRFALLIAELLGGGYTDEEARKFARGNLLRVMREAERVPEQLRKERDPFSWIPGGSAPAGRRKIHARSH